MNIKFSSHVTRLQEIRSICEKLLNNCHNQFPDGGVLDDVASLAGSMSTMSVSTMLVLAHYSFVKFENELFVLGNRRGRPEADAKRAENSLTRVKVVSTRT